LNLGRWAVVSGRHDDGQHGLGDAELSHEIEPAHVEQVYVDHREAQAKAPEEAHGIEPARRRIRAKPRLE
jgi:hypothetical protein